MESARTAEVIDLTEDDDNDVEFDNDDDNNDGDNNDDADSEDDDDDDDEGDNSVDETGQSLEPFPRSAAPPNSSPRSSGGLPVSCVSNNHQDVVHQTYSLNSLEPVEDDGESLFLPEYPDPKPGRSENGKKEKSVTFAASDTFRSIPNDNNGRKINRSRSKISVSSIRGPGKANSALTQPTSASSKGVIQRMGEKKRELARENTNKYYKKV